MAGKVYTLKPDLSYSSPLKKNQKKEEEIPLRERLIETLEKVLLFFISILFLVLSIGVAYKTLVYFKIKSESRKLLLEKQVMEEELKRLTSREVILEKAKVLGLRKPEAGDIIKLK
ncbi:hypothetical protein THC_0794 [Caldimicrobium thiodismutans]|uniref:Cell division protein FtsL n=1 Tax=Caldimicrobium thiodismutans TaxID=1653476 RepID=A0A0U5AQN2_9BACT|nr:hypothetical protein [Caldimicrobium thiodismutans]BAU23185.1 hypothetical protein THC_0794 [Caldimicrobium thiodismutans]